MFQLLLNRIRRMVPAVFLIVTLSACASVEVVIPATPTPAQSVLTSPTAAPVQPTPTTAAQPTATTAPAIKEGTFTLDTSGLAQGVSIEFVEAVQPTNDPSNERPYWEILPRHARGTLEGYPINNHLMKPQIFIYPAKDLAEWNPAAGNPPGSQLAALTNLLDSRQEVDRMPQMPMFNAAQVMHAQVKYMDFKNGQGVRFLTQYDQAPLPINNHELIYTYQGLTSDGQYYVAAILPVNYPGLPADELSLPEDPEKFMEGFPDYLAASVKMLNEEPAGAFTPDLAKLDAMMSSLEVK